MIIINRFVIVTFSIIPILHHMCQYLTIIFSVFFLTIEKEINERIT